MEPKIERIKYLNLLEEVGLTGEDCVITCTMALYGLRENNDLDIIFNVNRVSSIEELGNNLIEMRKGISGQSYMEYKQLDMFSKLAPLHGLYLITGLGMVDLMLKNYTEEHGGYIFLTLPVVISWKTAMGRIKDYQDIQIISEAILKHPNIVSKQKMV